MDKIKIKNLEVFARHGVFPEENRLGQKFLVSAVLYMDIRRAGQSDRLEDSADYGEAAHLIESYMKEHTFRLIERAAEGLAEELLLKLPLLEKVKVEIQKPWAPVGIPLESISVQLTRRWHTAYIALGSNMGDKKGYLDQAAEQLGRLKKCAVTKISPFYETPPYGMTEQDDFLNGCVELRTLLSPQELLSELHRMEQEAGRERVVHWGPRTLDLDLLLYDDLVVETDDLCIPHVEMHKREFVLKPLHDIAPYKRHPVYGKTVREMLEDL